MQEFKFVVGSNEQNCRIDRYIVEKLNKQFSRVFVQRLIENKNALLNEKPIKAHYKTKLGDVIYIKVPSEKEITIEPQAIPLDIVFEDEDVIVVNKPSGLVVHPAAGNYSGTLVNALLAHTKSLSSIDPLRPGIVHRLDKDTSGLIVMAKNNESHLYLSRQFQRHSVERTYLAVVSGKVEFDEGVIDAALTKDKKDFRKVKVGFCEGKKAKTQYRVINRTNAYSLLEIHPHTGRTHQIRVHLAFIGHPILGDVKYGRPQSVINRLALHALNIGFIHPKTAKFMSFSSVAPEEFNKFFK